MNKAKKNFNIFFENKDFVQNEQYSKTTLQALIRSVLEPVAKENAKAVVFTRLQDTSNIDSIIKRLEYSPNIILKEFSDFEFSKFDVEEVGFVVLTSQRYNAALLFKEVEDEKYEIYLKLNSKLVNDVYKALKTIFLIDYDEEFFEHKPERRENDLMNRAVLNIVSQFEETVIESVYNSKIQENYKNVNETNTSLRNEIYQNVRQIAHEIKNQLSILDIYARIFEKKTGDLETCEPIKKSIALIKSQVEQFKNLDVINLQERNIKQIIQETIKTYGGLLKEKNNKIILIDKIPDVEAKAFVDEEKFAIVIGNVIKNAHDVTSEDEIIIKLSEVEGKIKISIINHGERIIEENQNKIFEQGYTTKTDGWGVGLSVCKKFIGSQFGTFELAKSDEKETEFSILIPLV